MKKTIDKLDYKSYNIGNQIWKGGKSNGSRQQICYLGRQICRNPHRRRSWLMVDALRRRLYPGAIRRPQLHPAPIPKLLITTTLARIQKQEPGLTPNSCFYFSGGSFFSRYFPILFNTTQYRIELQCSRLLFFLQTFY